MIFERKKYLDELIAIKEIIKQKYGNLNAYAQEKNITPTQLYALLNGKEYLSLFSAVRFSTDFDLNIDYCTKGELPVLSPEHDYNMLLEAATEFFYTVRDEDKARDEFERKYDDLSSEEREQSKKYLEKLHETIQDVLRRSGHPLTFTEIAKQINAQKLYTRKDGQPVPASQISARVKSYSHLFDVNAEDNPHTVTNK